MIFTGSTENVGMEKGAKTTGVENVGSTYYFLKVTYV